MFFSVCFVVCSVGKKPDIPSLNRVQRSKALHRSAGDVTTDTLARFQVSQPAVIGSPIGRRTIVPASSGVRSHCK